MKNRIIKVIGKGCKYANITCQGMGLMCLTNMPEMSHKILFQDEEYNLTRHSASIYNCKVCYPELFNGIGINYGFNFFINRMNELVGNGKLPKWHYDALVKENLVIDIAAMFQKDTKRVKNLNQWK